MKKYLLLALFSIAIANLAACSNGASQNTAVDNSSYTSDNNAVATSDNAESSDDSDKTGDTNSANDADNADNTELSEADSKVEDNASTDSSEAISVSEIYNTIQNSVELISPVEMTDDFLENYYGIDLAMLDSYICVISEDATSAETVFIARLNNIQDSDAVSECISMVKEDKAAEMQDYLPEQYDIVTKSDVICEGNYVWLVISDNARAINDIIQESIKSK